MKSSSQNPNLYIIAGPNGAGKTTFAKEFLPQYAKCKNFVNADLIAQGVAPFDPETAAIKAGRIFLKQLHLLAEQNADFAFETTLAGKTYLSFLGKLKAKGYVIHIFFLWIPSVDLAIARIKDRVTKGGHHIPNKDVRRRFRKSFYNFMNYYQPLVDHWHMIDNSLIPPFSFARGQFSGFKEIDAKYLDLFKEKDGKS